MCASFNDTVSLPHIREHLTSAVVADILDAMGYRSQCLGAGLGALQSDGSLVGWAFPVSIERVSEVPRDPFRGLLSAVDAIGIDEVFVTSTDRATDVAVWGEMLSSVCQARGAAGVVTDGLIRDARSVRALGFQTFCAGTIPYDSKGRIEVTAHRVPCTIDGVRIDPGDLIVGDADGVVVVPRILVGDVIPDAITKHRLEHQFKAAVTTGMSAGEAFRRFGVL